MGKKIDVATVEAILGIFYPPPHDAPCLSRERQRLGDAAGLTQFGVNLLRLPPGAWSSQRQQVRAPRRHALRRSQAARREALSTLEALA
jgi:uncharacterized cupin superfamily protein